MTASASTLDSLIEMVRVDNHRGQLEMDEWGIKYRRSLDVSACCLVMLLRVQVMLIFEK